MGDLSLPTPVSIRILHVEDDQFQQMSMAAVVKMIEAKNSGAQLELVGATTGAEALQILESSDQFDLVLLDYKLPGGDGGCYRRSGAWSATFAPSSCSRNAQEASMQRCWLDLGACTAPVLQARGAAQSCPTMPSKAASTCPCRATKSRASSRSATWSYWETRSAASSSDALAPGLELRRHARGAGRGGGRLLHGPRARSPSTEPTRRSTATAKYSFLRTASSCSARCCTRASGTCPRSCARS